MPALETCFSISLMEVCQSDLSIRLNPLNICGLSVALWYYMLYSEATHEIRISVINGKKLHCFAVDVHLMRF